MVLKKEKDETKSVINELFKRLTRIDVLERYKIEFSDIREIEEDPKFIKKMSRMVNQKKFGAAPTFELFWEKFRAGGISSYCPETGR